MKPSAEGPIAKGGQGRSAKEVRELAWNFVLIGLLMGAMAVAVVASYLKG